MVVNLPETLLELIGMALQGLLISEGQGTELNHSYRRDKNFPGKLGLAGTLSCPSIDLPDQGKVFYKLPFLRYTGRCLGTIFPFQTLSL